MGNVDNAGTRNEIIAQKGFQVGDSIAIPHSLSVTDKQGNVQKHGLAGYEGVITKIHKKSGILEAEMVGPHSYLPQVPRKTFVHPGHAHKSDVTRNEEEDVQEHINSLPKGVENMSTLRKEQWIQNDDWDEFLNPSVEQRLDVTPQEGANEGFLQLHKDATRFTGLAHESGSAHAHRMAAEAHRLAAETAKTKWTDSSNAQDWIGYHQKLEKMHTAAAVEKMLKSSAYDCDKLGPEVGGYGHGRKGGPFREAYETTHNSLVLNSYKKAAYHANAAFRASKMTVEGGGGRHGSLNKKTVKALELTRLAGRTGRAVDLNAAAKAQEDAAKEHKNYGEAILQHAPISDKAQRERGHRHIETSYHHEQSAESLHQASRDTVHNASPEEQMRVLEDLGKWEQSKIQKAHEVTARIEAGPKHPLEHLARAVEAAHDSVLAHSGRWSQDYLPTTAPTTSAAKYALGAAKVAHQVGTAKAFEGASKALLVLGRQHLHEAEDREASIGEFRGQNRGQYLRDARASARLNRAAAVAAFEAGSAYALHANRMSGSKVANAQRILCNSLLKKTLAGLGVAAALASPAKAQPPTPVQAMPHKQQVEFWQRFGQHEREVLARREARQAAIDKAPSEAKRSVGFRPSMQAKPSAVRPVTEAKPGPLATDIYQPLDRFERNSTTNQTANALSRRSKILGILAHREIQAKGHNPVSWVKDEGKWEKAKKAVGDKYGGEDSARHWAVVTHVYEKMGGKIKGHKGTHNVGEVTGAVPTGRAAAHITGRTGQSLDELMARYKPLHQDNPKVAAFLAHRANAAAQLSDDPKAVVKSHAAYRLSQAAVGNDSPEVHDALARIHERVAALHPTHIGSAGRYHLLTAVAHKGYARSLRSDVVP